MRYMKKAGQHDNEPAGVTLTACNAIKNYRAIDWGLDQFGKAIAEEAVAEALGMEERQGSVYDDPELLDIISQCYSAAETLRSIILSLYNGNAYSVALHKISNLDARHWAFAKRLMDERRKFGETTEFFKLGEFVRKIEGC